MQPGDCSAQGLTCVTVFESSTHTCSYAAVCQRVLLAAERGHSQVCMRLMSSLQAVLLPLCSWPPPA